MATPRSRFLSFSTQLPGFGLVEEEAVRRLARGEFGPTFTPGSLTPSKLAQIGFSEAIPDLNLFGICIWPWKKDVLGQCQPPEIFGGPPQGPQIVPCPVGYFRTPEGRCVPTTVGPPQPPPGPFPPQPPPGPPPPGPGPGPGTSMVRLHQDTVPSQITRTVRRCQRGSVLGMDGWCHPRTLIRNSDRMWPRPRRPLLTGGDLNCIATASRAAKRLQKQTKRLKKLGMMK